MTFDATTDGSTPLSDIDHPLEASTTSEANSPSGDDAICAQVADIARAPYKIDSESIDFAMDVLYTTRPHDKPDQYRSTVVEVSQLRFAKSLEVEMLKALAAILRCERLTLDENGFLTKASRHLLLLRAAEAVFSNIGDDGDGTISDRIEIEKYDRMPKPRARFVPPDVRKLQDDIIDACASKILPTLGLGQAGAARGTDAAPGPCYVGNELMNREVR